MSESTPNGRIVKVAGPVVDAEFPPAPCPRSTSTPSRSTSPRGREKTVIAEVAQHVGNNKVRAIAMAPTDG
jgi:F-type H+/Na+-transporting ATPase subunit beta